MSYSSPLFDPCKVCALRPVCSDECARVGFSLDVPRSPRFDREAVAFVNQISMIPVKS